MECVGKTPAVCEIRTQLVLDVSQIITQSGNLFLASTISICSNEGRFIYFFSCVTLSPLGKGEIVTFLSFHCLQFISYPPLSLSFPPFFSPWLHCQFLFIQRATTTSPEILTFYLSSPLFLTPALSWKNMKRKDRVRHKLNSRLLLDISRTQIRSEHFGVIRGKEKYMNHPELLLY